MPTFDITEKRPHINIFKLGGAYYFKHFFDDPELFSLNRSMRRRDTGSGWLQVVMGTAMSGGK